MDTGFPSQDAQTDFRRARRRQVLSRLAKQIRFEPDDVSEILPFDEVVEALGHRGERSLGLQSIPLDAIVGTVDRRREFDRSFMPKSANLRPRWQRIAEAQRRGKSMPPIDVYRICETYFVKDGHHRVSVARAQGRDRIDAYVTLIETELPPGKTITPADLPVKSHERIFFERVPLEQSRRERIRLSDPIRGYSELAEGVEAWGFRSMQSSREWMDRTEIAKLWFEHEYEPVVAELRSSDLIGKGTETDAYMRVAAERWFLRRTHGWDEQVWEALTKRP